MSANRSNCLARWQYAVGFIIVVLLAVFATFVVMAVAMLTGLLLHFTVLLKVL